MSKRLRAALEEYHGDLRAIKERLRELHQRLRAVAPGSDADIPIINEIEKLEDEQRRKLQKIPPEERAEFMDVEPEERELEELFPGPVPKPVLHTPIIPQPFPGASPPSMLRRLGKDPARAQRAIASHERAARALSIKLKGKPGHRKALALRRTVEHGTTKSGKPRIVSQLGKDHTTLPSLGQNVAFAIGNASAKGAQYFAQNWEGKGRGLQLSKVVGNYVKEVQMPSYGQFRNQLSKGLRDNAKYYLLQARAARIAYNKYKNQMFGRRTQAMRLTKYGSKYSHRKAGLRQVEEDFPIAV